MKRRIIQGFLIGFAIWPLVQYGAVLRYGVDPWKLCAFGMYTVPGPMKTLRLALVSDEGETLVIDPKTYSAREGRAAIRFVEYRRALGRLARPEDLLNVFFEDRPGLESLVVGLTTLKLDRNSARLVSSFALTRFDRQRRAMPFELKAPREL